jgi:hypothetical protein
VDLRRATPEATPRPPLTGQFGKGETLSDDLGHRLHEPARIGIPAMELCASSHSSMMFFYTGFAHFRRAMLIARRVERSNQEIPAGTPSAKAASAHRAASCCAARTGGGCSGGGTLGGAAPGCCDGWLVGRAGAGFLVPDSGTLVHLNELDRYATPTMARNNSRQTAKHPIFLLGLGSG